MKSLFIYLFAAMTTMIAFTSCMTTRNTGTTGSDNEDKTRTTTTEVGRGTTNVTTTEDNLGNSVVMTSVFKRNRVVAWNVVIISKTTKKVLFEKEGLVASLDNKARLKRAEYGDLRYYDPYYRNYGSGYYYGYGSQTNNHPGNWVYQNGAWQEQPGTIHVYRQY